MLFQIVVRHTIETYCDNLTNNDKNEFDNDFKLFNDNQFQGMILVIFVKVEIKIKEFFYF